MHVLERDAVELALVDVGDAVILAPLRAAARRLQVVLEPVRGKPAPIIKLSARIKSYRHCPTQTA